MKKQTLINMFIAALLIITTLETAQISINPRMSTSFYIHTVEYYPAIKMNELLVHSVTINLKSILLRESSRQKCIKYIMIPPYEILRSAEITHGDRNYPLILGIQNNCLVRDKKSFWGNGNVLCLDTHCQKRFNGTPKIWAFQCSEFSAKF